MSPQDPVSETITGTTKTVEGPKACKWNSQVICIAVTSITWISSSREGDTTQPTIHYPAHQAPSVCPPDLRVQPGPGLPSYSYLSVRQCGGKERQGRVLDCVKQVLGEDVQQAVSV